MGAPDKGKGRTAPTSAAEDLPMSAFLTTTGEEVKSGSIPTWKRWGLMMTNGTTSKKSWAGKGHQQQDRTYFAINP